jgi:hypothetical protein
MKKIILSALLLASTVTFAQEEKSPLTISGSVDTYYSTNLTTATPGSTGILTDVPANGFGLGMANVVIGYETEKGGVVADLAYGPRANAANMYNVIDGAVSGAINQLYAYYNISDKFTATLGQFNTFYGYEVISPAGNFNYSVSYLFNAGPFSHTGLKVDYAATEDLSLMLAVTNPHGIYTGSNLTGDYYQLGFQAGYKGQYLNLAYGADGFGFTDVLYLDYTGGFNATESFYIGINAAYSTSADADSGYQGAALYLENTFSDSFALGLRPEFFQNNGANDDSVLALTLTANTSLTENLKLISELRYDGADAGTSYAPVGGKDNVSALTIAAVYSF